MSREREELFTEKERIEQAIQEDRRMLKEVEMNIVNRIAEAPEPLETEELLTFVYEAKVCTGIVRLGIPISLRRTFDIGAFIFR